MIARVGLLLALAGALAGCDASGEPLPPSGTPIWGRRLGKSTSLDRMSLAVDAAGNAVVGGRFFATADFGAGPVTSPANNWQAFVAKYDREGALLWMQSFGDIYEEGVDAVGVDGAGNVYVAGTFRGTVDFGGGPLQTEGLDDDVFVAKLTPDGGHVWSKRFGVAGTYDFLQTMAVGADGSVALLGRAGDGTDFGSGPIVSSGGSFVVRLDPTGKAAFVKTISYDDPSVTVWDPTTLAHGPGGSVVVASTSYDEFGSQQRISKLGRAGDIAWEKTFSGDGSDVGAIAVAEDGGVFLTGRLTGDVAFENGVTASGNDFGRSAYVAALASDGTARWIEPFVPQEVDAGEGEVVVDGFVSTGALAATASGVVVTGAYYGVADFGGGARESGVFELPEDNYGSYYYQLDNVFALRLDAQGGYAWDASFPSKAMQRGTSVAVDPSGDVLLAGSANGSLPFAPGTFDGTAYYEGFVVKLAR